MNVSQNAVKRMPKKINIEPTKATWRKVKRLNMGPLRRPGIEEKRGIYKNV